MVKSYNSAITKSKLVRFSSVLTELALNTHVIYCFKIAIVQLLSNSLNKVDIDLRTTLYNEIVLSGGNTMFTGFPDRFIKELKRFLPNEVKSRILAPARRDTMCWEGGSILASLPSFKNMWITRAEYNEQKDQVFAKKTFWLSLKVFCISYVFYKILT